jgi:catechol 2,3-dioxygenase-like lactoylglutathione lyase family enzyme
MIRIATTQLWVHDQDEALEFWRDKVGMEVRQDVTVPEMGNFRWLTVSPQGQEDVAIVLMKIMGPPLMDDATTANLETLMGQGLAGTVFLTTPDCRKSVEELRGRGVEFTEEPDDRPYGLDAAFRDPSGNSIRLTQLRPMS